MPRLIKESKREGRVLIPTASMSDIATLLIIFFVLTTVFRKEVGLKVILPQAANTERILKSRDLANIYIDKEGRISVDDKLVDPDRIRTLFRAKYSENTALIVQIKADEQAPYGPVDKVIEALREGMRDAPQIRIVFATLPKR
ncbi:MAG: biopolymer transporter ExbD [Candidatus Hydrothermae bacterium]|jgi:biopolymer transport protein ExbD|nr:biopolymer transporter ExbD [Candidatus Hydrothermae bacterium]